MESNQDGPHPRLLFTVEKHLKRPWRQPYASHSLETFREILSVLKTVSTPLVLDSGCGVGESTVALAKKYPDRFVLGVDKSIVRLSKRKSGDVPPNCAWFRADLEDFWRLAAENGVRFERQTFYYPNPWPKAEHRQRRWAQSPVFPSILACGGICELRTNWIVYAREWAIAFEAATGVRAEVVPWNPPEPETPFERKYIASGHALWSFEALVPPGWRPPYETLTPTGS